jgi:MFS family permease
MTAVLHTPVPGEVAPEAGRRPGAIHAFILLVTSSLSVLVTAVLGPSLPMMQAHFAGVPHADYLVPLTMMVPMLMMALCSVGFGLLSDRIGRKRLLVGATALYGVFGSAPLVLDSLAAIVASRVALGIAEAALMVVSTTMIGDYWQGAQRQRMVSLQVTVAASSAFVLNNLGGVMAELGWRAPYTVYGASLLLAPLMAAFLWEPLARSPQGPPAARRDDVPFRPRLLALLCLLGLGTGLVFSIVFVHLGFLFGAIGVTSPTPVGVAYGLNSLGVISGTLLFGWVLARRLEVAAQLAAAAAIAALGFLLMKGADTYAALTIAGVVNGVGCGILLPTMVTWLMRTLPMAQRGLGNGAYQSAQFLGMFINPVVVVGLHDAVGSRGMAVAVVGIVLAGLALVATLVALARRP